MTTTTSSEILRQTTAFISQALIQSDLRQRLLSSFRRSIPPSEGDETALNALNLAAQTLERAIFTTKPSIRSSSLGLAEKLLLNLNSETSFSFFILSLINFLRNQPTDASLNLLRVFQLDPCLARAEIAPCLFEELFLVHLLPVLQWFNEERTRILSSITTSSSNIDNDGDYEISSSMVIPFTKLLSKMSGGQASELKELERNYEEVIDMNCRAFALYFKEVLENGDDRFINPPSLVLNKIGCAEKFDSIKDENNKTDNIGLQNGRYNPIWVDEDKSFELYSGNSNSKSLPCYPQRVSLSFIKNRNSWKLTKSWDINLSQVESSLEDSSANFSSSDFEAEIKENNTKMASSESVKNLTQKQKMPLYADSSRSLDHLEADMDNPLSSGKHTPPKDFVCPITSHLLDDPVTLETGQTYERRAIEEWLNRGNSTCPITRQNLHSMQLPKTNYVLKRLIASWQENNPCSVSNDNVNDPLKTEPIMIKSNMPATSPNSVIRQDTINGTMSDLRHAITNLCMSDVLKESEMAVLQIERFWHEADIEDDVQSMLSKPAVINGFVEILSNSSEPLILRATVLLLCELGSRDKTVIQTLMQVHSDVECIVALFKKGLMEAVVLIYLLSPSVASLVKMDIVRSLLEVIKREDDGSLNRSLQPKSASVFLLQKLLASSEDNIVSSVVNTIVSSTAIESIIKSLEAEAKEERIAAVGILLRCTQEDGKCRNIISDKAQLAPILEILTDANDVERFEIVHFLFELVKLSRRTFNKQILHIIKDEGPFSTMHILLVLLQTACQEHCPVIAGLLIQLDILTEPRKMSIYREEAIDALISCLRNTDLPSSQIAAAETIVSLQGKFTFSGKTLTRASLLKTGGLEKHYKSLMEIDQLNNDYREFDSYSEEEKEADDWEKKIAFVLVSHEFGLIFEALAEGFNSGYAELASASFEAATWLVTMFRVLPDTGIRGAARVCLLKHFISIFKSANNSEDKVLSLLALNSFMNDPEGLRDVTSYLKDIMKGLRELGKSSSLAQEMLKVFFQGNEFSADLWSHKELAQVDCKENGEVLAIVCFKDKIFSGHSDGTIKVWTGRGSILHLIQEVREHTKAVTSLVILHSGERLYSGSTDKTTRVWSIGNDVMHSVQVYDMKDQVHNLLVANSIACFIPQGAGIKVNSWNGQSKLLNQNKHVKCMALAHGTLFCGCHDSSIHEIDLATGTFSTIQSGSRKLLAKANPINALQVYDGLIYSASSPSDGAAVKIWSSSNYNMIGSLPTTLEVRAMAISSELIYLGCKGGSVEVWDRKQHIRTETLQAGTTGKVLCVALDINEEMLVTGTSDGLIQAWGVN